jgi:beta-lactamase regulating signal transducer with metallopeptidase domain
MIPLLQILLQSSIRATIVALVVGLLLAAARIRSSSLRHTAWLAVLCAMPMMPVLPYVVPAALPPVPVPSISSGMFDPPLYTESRTFRPDSVPLGAAVPARPRIVQPAAIGVIVSALYVAGLLALSCRLLAGWLALRKVVRTSTPISGQSAPVFESPHLATPVTVGVIDPKILLPCSWNQWPQEKLRAALAHELAHLQRRDTLTTFLAHLNRCVFWFHPLAWWLLGQLAFTAECACDDAAVRAIGDSRQYAALLLDMAEAMRRSGKRLSWPAPGVGGADLLTHRIDRILRGGADGLAVCQSRTLLTAASCALVILIVAACREKSAPQLKEDPALSRERAERKRSAEFTHAIHQMNSEQVAALEQQVHDHPTDLDARKKLMSFYQTAGRKLLGDEKTIEAFRAHKLWFIRNHPEDRYGLWANPLSDPTGYEAERKLWLRVAEQKGAPEQAVQNAAQFFAAANPQLAEKLYLRAHAASSLARLYASVLSGPASLSPYAKEVRRKLDQSNDPALLEWTGVWLQRNAGSDTAALARSYLERSIRMNPDSNQAHIALTMLKQREVGQAVPPVIPNSLDFRQARLAEAAYWRGESLDYYQHDRLAAKTSWELARNYAHDALQLAPKYRSDANYGTAIYKANMTLGMIAMRVDGDKTAAAKYLLEASKAPANDELNYLVDGFILKLPVALLRYGGAAEREAVIEFLERFGRILKRRDLDLLHAARQLRQGYMPIWYEVQAAQLK